MLENLLNLIKENAGDTVINNPAIPNEHNDAVVQEAGSSILGGLQGLLASGGAKEVLSLFSNPSNVNSGNPIVQQLSGGFLQSLVSKFNLDSNQASGIASSLIPTVLSQLVSKSNSPADNGFSVQGLFNTISGGSTSSLDIQGLVGKFSQGGLDRDGDGDVDLQDLTAAFAGGGATGGSGGGNPLDALKGLFGN